MTRKWLLALLALVLVTPALAQVMRIPRPVVIQPVQPPPTDAASTDVTPDGTPTFDITLDPARARAVIEKLVREKRELNVKLTDALAMIDQMTTRGGSLVRAYCESRTLSRNTAGASENCAAGGYVCGEVDGLCKRGCTISTDCATNFTCDPATSRCVRTG